MTPEQDRELRYLRHWFLMAEEALKGFVRNYKRCGSIPDRDRESAYHTAVAVLAREDDSAWSLTPPGEINQGLAK